MHCSALLCFASFVRSFATDLSLNILYMHRKSSTKCENNKRSDIFCVHVYTMYEILILYLVLYLHKMPRCRMNWALYIIFFIYIYFINFFLLISTVKTLLLLYMYVRAIDSFKCDWCVGSPHSRCNMYDRDSQRIRAQRVEY